MATEFPLFPLFLDLSGRSCLFVWGDDGQEALCKLSVLQRAGARVTVVGATGMPPESLAALVERGEVSWRALPLEQAWLDGVHLVVSGASCADTNLWLAEQAARRGIPLNVIDQREYCTAIWPAILDRGVVQVAISTGGSSPALAGHLRRRLATVLPDNTDAFARWLQVWRQRVSSLLPSLAERGRFWRTLLEHGVWDVYTQEGVESAERLVQASLPQTRDDPSRDSGTV